MSLTASVSSPTPAMSPAPCSCAESAAAAALALATKGLGGELGAAPAAPADPPILAAPGLGGVPTTINCRPAVGSGSGVAVMAADVSGRSSA